MPQKVLPEQKPLAFLSDIHGNNVALHAVLKELKDSGVERVYAAGDLFLPGAHPGDPREVWQILSDAHVQCIRGLSDTALVSVDASMLQAKDASDEQRLALFLATRAALGELILERVRRLPLQMRLPMIDGREIVMTHGSPGDATLTMSHDMSDDELLACVADDPADVVICGGSHVPFDREIAGVRIVNVGSVGDAPEGNTAHFTVLEPRMSGAQIDQRWVEY